MQVISLKNKCFVVWSNEIKNRLDPFFLKYQQGVGTLSYKFPVIPLGKLLRENPQYGANESAIDGNPQKDVRYIRITDIDEFGDLKSDEWKTVRKIENKYLLEENDILFARSGATAGKTFIYKKEIGKAIFGGYLIKFKIDETKASPKFVFYFTQLKPYLNWVKSIQRPSGQPNINSEEFKSVKIPLPPLPTQNQIVKIMQSAYNQKTEKEQEAEELLNSIDDYVLDELNIKIPKMKDKMCFKMDSEEMTNRLDSYYHQPKFKEIENDFKRGKYKIIEFGSVIKNINYGTIPKEYSNTGIPLLKIGNLKPNEIMTTELSYIPDFPEERDKQKITQKGDLLISQLGTVGITAPITEREKGFLYGSFILRLQISQGNPMYFSIILNSPIGKIQFQRDMTTATVRTNTSIPAVKSLKIPFPSLEIQDKIAKEVKSRIEKAKKLKSEAKNIVKNAKKEVEEIILGKSL